MKKIIKFFRLKWLEMRLLKAHKKAIIEAEADEIKYRSSNFRIHLFLNEAEKIYEEWHKMRYDK